MNQRDIPRSFAVATVRSPDIEVPSYHFRKELYKKFGKNHLKVVVKNEENNIVVVTVHWVEKIKRA